MIWFLCGLALVLIVAALIVIAAIGVYANPDQRRNKKR